MKRVLGRNGTERGNGFNYSSGASTGPTDHRRCACASDIILFVVNLEGAIAKPRASRKTNGYLSEKLAGAMYHHVRRALNFLAVELLPYEHC